MVEIVKLGGLRFNGNLVPVGARYNGERISFGDTAPELAIPFIKWEGLYVAAQCVCIGIGWADLDKYGFIYGHPVKIDGAPYLCRSLKAGAEWGDPNEWDSFVNACGEDDCLLHWRGQYFWGQESFLGNTTEYVMRGYSSARFQNYGNAEDRHTYVGFRPVLKPLSPGLTVSKSLIGRNIVVYGSGTSVTGRLTAYTDYDLELEIGCPLPEDGAWFRRVGTSVFIDREAVVYIGKGRLVHGGTLL